MSDDQDPTHEQEIFSIRPQGGTLARIEWLRSRGVIGPPGPRSGKLMPIGPAKPGALQRFLEERG